MATAPGISGRTLGTRPGWAAALLALAAAAGGLTYALIRDTGLAAVAGRRAVANTIDCYGRRANVCDAEVIGRDGSITGARATVRGFTRLESETTIHVRSRGGRVTPDTLPERTAQAGLLLFLAGAAGAALLGAGALLAGRGGRAAAVGAAVPVAGVAVFLLSVGATVVAGAPTLNGGQPPVPDIYARVAAEPERTLDAQGVRFELLDHQPMSRAGCFTAPGCLLGAVAHWKAAGTDLLATSHLLVFDGPASAASTAATIQRTKALPDAPAPPTGALVIGIDSGRYASALWISRADGGEVRQDPRVESALKGLAYFNTQPALAEELRRARR